MNEERNEFDELATNALFAVNALMQHKDVCRKGNAVLKINRFKAWLINFMDDMQASAQTPTTTQVNNEISNN